MTQSDPTPVLIESTVPTHQPVFAQEFERTRQIADLIGKIAIVAAVLNLIAIIVITLVAGALFAGKVVLIEVMFGISLLCLAIVIGHGKIMSLLSEAEDIAYLARDQAFVDLNMARDELSRLRRKLSREVDETGHTSVSELLKTASPLIMMFIQKEKNIFRWGMFAVKVAQNAIAVMKHQQQQRSKEP